MYWGWESVKWTKEHGIPELLDLLGAQGFRNPLEVAVLDNWAMREAARSADALEAVLESIRSRLGSSRVELHYKADSGLEP